MLKELVEHIAKSLADHPEQVRVEEVPDERGSVLELHVAESDMGRVIGKKGKTAQAIRAVLSAASTRAEKQTLLRIIE